MLLALGLQMIGPIPASAGETDGDQRSADAAAAYPRERGGNFVLVLSAAYREGLSPRARGKPATPAHINPASGPIPASAGETIFDLVHGRNRRAYPRERGGNA